MATIYENLTAPGVLTQLRGIMQCVLEKRLTEEERDALLALRDGDDFRMFGRSVPQFAYAALDVLGISDYKGDDWIILDLIPNMNEIAEYWAQ